jgi:hypothetical protein
MAAHLVASASLVSFVLWGKLVHIYRTVWDFGGMEICIVIMVNVYIDP